MSQWAAGVPICYFIVALLALRLDYFLTFTLSIENVLPLVSKLCSLLQYALWTPVFLHTATGWSATEETGPSKLRPLTLLYRSMRPG
jgi:hypothetical protein